MRKYSWKFVYILTSIWQFFKNSLLKKSWKFVYNLAKRCKSDLNLTIFFRKKSRKKSWKFVYILSKHCKSHLNLTKVNLKKNAKIIVKVCLHSHFNLTNFSKKNHNSTNYKDFGISIQNLSGLVGTHYSKSQIFVQKFNFDKTPTFSRVFHPNFFRQFFSWDQSCQQLKRPKPQHFHEFFTPKNR